MPLPVHLVLHSHMPWVLQHGSWPHGEHWLFEAAAGVYLPLLRILDGLNNRGSRSSLTVGITPILSLQLSHPRFKSGFNDYMLRQIERSTNRIQHQPLIGEFWREHYQSLYAYWQNISENIPGAFLSHVNQGRVELLRSFATHAFAPLTSSDLAIDTQLNVGAEIFKEIYGYVPTGLWLPECAFRPLNDRQCPVNGTRTARMGIDSILASHGISHFFVEENAFMGLRSEGWFDGSHFNKRPWSDAETDDEWRSCWRGKRVSTSGEHSEIVAFARHSELCSQIWSADIGYPGDPNYLEFHWIENGLKCHRVTDRRSHDKATYDPLKAQKIAKLHAYHFAGRLHREASTKPNATSLTLCFDSELFGHWWFEGPIFLNELFKLIDNSPLLELSSAQETVLQQKHPEVVWLPETTWGDAASQHTWINSETHWMWKHIHECEAQYFNLKNSVDEQSTKLNKQLLDELKWELLMLQASDWPFVISTKGAVDYGYRRFCQHLERFTALQDCLTTKLNHKRLSSIQKAKRKEAQLHQIWRDVLGKANNERVN